MITLTRLQAILAGYRIAYYSDCPEVKFRIKDLHEDDFDDNNRTAYGILMIQETEIHLIP